VILGLSGPWSADDRAARLERQVRLLSAALAWTRTSISVSAGDFPDVRPGTGPYRRRMLLPLVILSIVNIVVPALLLRPRAV
jgi:hypothetical protein